MTRGILSMFTALAMLAAAPARAETAREMLDRAKAVNDAREPKDTTQKTKMTLVDSRGGARVRDLEMYSKSYGHRTRRALTFFLSPPEVKGVGLLSWSYPDRDDAQWLYLPELRRVRQISGASRKQSFQGSDFSYDDIELVDDLRDWTEEEAASRLVRENEIADGVPCAVIELVPRDRTYDYARFLLWLDREGSTFRKIEFYDKKDDSLLKTLTLGGFRSIDGVPTAQHVEMANAKKGTKTVIEFSETRYNRGLTDEVFSERTLERGRVD
jgi:hypothetical protein